MKRSPLQLEWVTYPTASYEFLEDASLDGSQITVEVSPEVIWSLDGSHMASMSIRNSDDSSSPYRFNIIVAAVFRFDVDGSARHYNVDKTVSLPAIISTNVCRILFSGAREQIAMMTSRAPAGSAVIESVVIEPSDIKISSAVEPEKILEEVFRVPKETIRKITQKAKEVRKKKVNKKLT